MKKSILLKVLPRVSLNTIATKSIQSSINKLSFVTPKNISLNLSQAGFTLIEMGIVVIMVGILSAIAIPSWLSFVQARRLTAAQEQVYRSILEAQSNAKREKLAWETCFRDDGTRVLWSTRSVPTSGISTSCSNATNWQPLIRENANTIAIDTTNTTLDDSQTGYYRRQFEYNGSANPPFGRITLIVRNDPRGTKRCVFVSTLLGALRTDKDSGCI